MNFVLALAPLLHKDHRYVLGNTSCSLPVTPVPLMDCTAEGKLVYLILLFSFLLVIAITLSTFVFLTVYIDQCFSTMIVTKMHCYGCDRIPAYLFFFSHFR